MNSNQVRNIFIDFFKNNDHTHVNSSSLVPDNDPTLMFANSGMVQFKNVFTGLEHRDYRRATTSQKCVRAGGKHNDLENVGFTTRHHTFFEMLGNFSFGDYFKEEAIFYAWNLITKEYQINPDKLLVTIYHDDVIAEQLWKKIANLKDDKIIKIKTSDNFWSMGDTGPCGPCSEIFYDHGDKYFGGPPGSPNEDGDRFIEIWNLVFMQYEQIDTNTRIDLPNPCVDTGMGLERITALMNNSNDNYSSDLFTNIINATQEIIKEKLTEENKSSFRVIADHLRASSFLIADGVIPSNEGRGYVLRRILRRGIRHAYSLGSKDLLFDKIFNNLQSLMGDFFDELNTRSDLIKETLSTEENKFRETLSKGLEILGQELPNIKKDTLDGKIAFKLYDTYGFPLDLTQDYLKSKNINVDIDSFNTAMEAQKHEARASWKGSGDDGIQKIWFDLAKKFKPTVFEGYTKSSISSEIISIIQDNKEVDSVNKANQDFALIAINTCFYGESGGQIGDRGKIFNNNFEFQVTDTKKTPQGIFIHFGKLVSGSISINDNVKMELDLNLRDLVKKNHSATHLLHAALRNQLGNHVAQRGSLVNDEKLRFDFSHNKQITREQLQSIQEEVINIINNSYKTNIEIKSQEEAIKQGAMALFGEKYGDEVRVVSLGEVNGSPYSIELCGGTHVDDVKDINKFQIIGVESVSSGVRRIEACTDKKVDFYLDNQSAAQKELENKYEFKIKELNDQIISLNGKINFSEDNKSLYIKKLENYLDSLKNKSILSNEDNNQKTEEKINDITFVTQIIHGLPPKELRSIFDNFKSNNIKSILACVTINEDKISIIVGLTDDLVNTYDARDLIKLTFEHLGSKGGGGRVDFAQAGGDQKDHINQAFSSIKAKI
ncbi:MAG: alanine--tRNA ligase [alpha proteobacterium HIMB59]|nr:MAG: alanine--tRNA ligase [alpha proteobacterium HIMB59]